ncbi:DUF6879 family protein [Streptomonospora nanhaiensis]|uniref:DUF6879 domain-containing protein n=1 Tax=Streptomonospora nanhaiensis TaxID=1323731 RepID=A0A853BIG2_9ACTN|nr:DUF6879 family protein [Streptomonospora nanhaiensis]MBV2365017.1 hypothetical protein [Streptomonospora nanhaiensis]MBX9389098.1 hypothetical protein [Streptomonospora nanhaiensis]NYI94525.1 hypothetical protein [Streptomonospora nanhaiensis]
MAFARGRHLDLAAYLADFEKRISAPESGDIWKLERRQRFRQPESESWSAFAAGAWDEALRILDDAGPSVRGELVALAGSGIRVHRLRVAERPLTPYLQWEFHSLRIRHRHGEDIRVGGGELVARFEREHELPEILIIGDSVMYKIRYTESGVLCGAESYADAAVIAACRDEIARMHSAAVPLPEYFARHVATLPPPHGE